MFFPAFPGLPYIFLTAFVLISGYFLIERTRFSLKKPVELLIITAFYGFISYVFFVCTDSANFSVAGALQAVFPFVIGKRWFVETYIILLLFAPFINKLLTSLDKKTFRLLLILQLTVFCLWYSLGLSAPLLDDGYGIINFLTLYMLGGYVRLYGRESKWLNLRKCYYGLIFLGCALLTFVLSYFINPYGYAFVTNIVGAFTVFLFFLKWELRYCKNVNRIATASFDVYFVHSDFNMSRLLFYHLLGAKFVADTPWMIPHILIVIPVVWLIGFVAHTLRKRLFAVSVDRWLNRIGWIVQLLEI